MSEKISIPRAELSNQKYCTTHFVHNEHNIYNHTDRI